MSWFNIAIAVIGVVLSVVLAPGPPKKKPPSTKDLEIPTAEEGRTIPIIFGKVRVRSVNVVWYGDVSYKAVKTKSGK